MTPNKRTIAEEYEHARCAGTSIIAVESSDVYAMLSKLQAVEAGLYNGTDNESPALLYTWNTVEGLLPLISEGASAESAQQQEESALLALGRVLGGADRLKMRSELTSSATALVKLLPRFPAKTVIFALHGTRYFSREHSDPATASTFIAGVSKIRTPFSKSDRCLVFLSPAVEIPAELEPDIWALREPYPTRAEIVEIVRYVAESAEYEITDEEARAAASTMTSMSPYMVEQALAMSLASGKLDLEYLRERQRDAVRRSAKVNILPNNADLCDIGGNEAVLEMLLKIGRGKRAPEAILLLDDFEKMGLGRHEGDSTNVTGNQLEQLLTYTEDNEVLCLIFLGVGGTGKTQIVKAAGKALGVPVMQASLGAQKEKWVGSSESNMRKMLDTVTSVSNGSPLIIATMNKATIPPELMRRFRHVFFFDLPTKLERAAIWKIYARRYGLKLDPLNLGFDDSGWTGAEIKACCDDADRFGISVAEAASDIMPVSRTKAADIEALRAAADGLYMSASRRGPYSKDEVEEASGSGRRTIRQRQSLHLK